MKSIKYESNQLNGEIIIDYLVNYGKNNKIEDAFYFLDGQNAFDDKLATYGRSLRAIRHLDTLNKGYLAIGIRSPKSNNRLNLYSPFKIEDSYSPDFTNNPKQCERFISDLTNIIVTTFNAKYNIKRNHLIASSLAASLSIYINSISDKFHTMCILSNANFIFDKAMYEHLNTHRISNASIYLGVGKKESSDGSFNSKDYLDSYNKYRDYLKEIGARYIAKAKPLGKHNEASWEKHLKCYLKNLNRLCR